MKLQYNAEFKDRARTLRKHSTLSEVLLWQEIKNRKLHGFKFIRQRPIGRYIVDFVCKEALLAIEIDGDSHLGKEDYDAARDAYLCSLGLNVLHFHDLDVKRNIGGVLYEIEKELKNR